MVPQAVRDAEKLAIRLADMQIKGQAFSPEYLALYQHALDVEAAIYESGFVCKDSLDGRITACLRARGYK